MITLPVLSTTEAITHAIDVMSNDLKEFAPKVFASVSEIDSFIFLQALQNHEKTHDNSRQDQ